MATVRPGEFQLALYVCMPLCVSTGETMGIDYWRDQCMCVAGTGSVPATGARLVAIVAHISRSQLLRTLRSTGQLLGKLSV